MTKSPITQQMGLRRLLRNSISLNENGGFRSPGATIFHTVMLLGSASAYASLSPFVVRLASPET